MTIEEKRYRQTVNAIGISAIGFLALLFLRSRVLALVSLLLGTSMRSYLIAYHLVGGVLYAAMFCLPVLLFYKLVPKTERAPMHLEWQMPRGTLLCVFFGVAVVLSCAYLNGMLIRLFEQLIPVEPLPPLEEGLPTANYELVLMLFSSAVVPAFAEEFFFRGMVLENLRPYGRTTAILWSALLFGLMHQSADQIFYTVMAGVVIGWVYVRTESIWPCVLLHFVNNFTSVLTNAFEARLPHSTYVVLSYTVDGVIFLAGLICGIFLFLSERDHRAALRAEGAFERALPPSAEYAPVSIPPIRRFQLFFSVPMIIYIVVCIATMLGLFTYC